jgi:hypothetical protein
VDKHKRKLEKRLRKFNERRCILNERKRFIQIIVNKCCKSSVYFELINTAIKRLDSDVLKGLADELRELGSNVFNSDLYEKYRALIADELWKDDNIRAMFPGHFFYVHKSESSLLLWVNIRSFDLFDGYWKSPEDIIISYNKVNYKLCWSDHAVTRLIERYKDSSYSAFADVACILYFLNWFDIKVYKDDKYICIYMINENNVKQCNLIGVGPVVLSDGLMVVKTFLPCDFVSNHYGLNLVIAKPVKFGNKCSLLDKAGFSEPLYKSNIINRWGK